MKPKFSAAAGHVERKAAIATSTLRNQLAGYWKVIKQDRTRQAWYRPEEVVPYFEEYGLSVFDAKAAKHLKETKLTPQSFIEFLRVDLVAEIWREIEGESGSSGVEAKEGVWRRMIEDSVNLASFNFPSLPGRSIRKTDVFVSTRSG